MTTRFEVESAIEQMPEAEVRNLAKWLQDYLDNLWERQLETDLATGKLDALIARAEAEIESNQVRDLHEVLYNG
jgi:hypothetical protein